MTGGPEDLRVVCATVGSWEAGDHHAMRCCISLIANFQRFQLRSKCAFCGDKSSRVYLEESDSALYDCNEYKWGKSKFGVVYP